MSNLIANIQNRFVRNDVDRAFLTRFTASTGAAVLSVSSSFIIANYCDHHRCPAEWLTGASILAGIAAAYYFTTQATGSYLAWKDPGSTDAKKYHVIASAEAKRILEVYGRGALFTTPLV